MSLQFDLIPPPNWATKKPRDEYRWYYRVTEILNGMIKMLWRNVDTTGSKLTDIETRPHSDLQSILQADDTSSSTTAGKHVTNAQIKVYGDHVRKTDDNPHGTNWDQLEGTVNHIPFSLTPSAVPTTAGTASWNAADGTVDFKLLNGVTLQTGQETYFYGKASGNIANGELCQFAGVQGDHILIKKAVAADIIAYPHYLLGVATHSITNGNFGYVTYFGKVNGVYTKTPANNDSADWAVGDLLYFDNTTGQLTKTKPDAPKSLIIVAAVIKEQTGSSENGIIIVRATFGIRFTDCDDVDGTPSSYGDFYTWNDTNKYFEPSRKIGDGTNYSEFESTGFQKYTGSAKYWRDIDFPILIRTTGVGIPTLEVLNGNITAPQWQVNDFNQCESQEFVHEWEEESQVTWHIHTTTNGLDATDRYLRFTVEYGYVTPHGQWVFPASLDSGDLLIPANTPDKTMIIFNLGTFTPTSTSIGGHCIAYLKRIASTGTAPTNNPWMPMLQLHIRCDTPGSRLISDK